MIFKDHDYTFRDADYVFKDTAYIEKVQCCYRNLLESSTVTLTAGTEDASYPIYRLYDRGIGRLFKITSAETLTIKIAQGSSKIYPADRLFIPAGHNLDLASIELKCSDDAVTYASVIPTSQIRGSGQIELNWPLSYHQYWEVTIRGVTGIPQIAELFLGELYTWEQNPEIPSGPLDNVFNVENLITAGGSDRFHIHGDPKRQRIYHIKRCEDTQKQNILLLNNLYASAKPFFLYDHTGEWIFGKLIKPIELIPESEHEDGGYYSFDFHFLEVLGI